MPATPSSYLAVIADRDALRWVVTEQRMAFPSSRPRSELRELAAGDQLWLYTTRGCFRSPVADRGRVIGTATVKTPPTLLSEPVVLREREFPIGCDITVEDLAQYRGGVELYSLLAKLDVFAGSTAANWGMRLRRPLVKLSPGDVRTLSSALRGISRPRSEVLDSYEHPTWPQRERALRP